MIRRARFLLFNNVSGESPSFRAKPMRNLQVDVCNSPYKEQFKDYWATPIPWAKREYGEKPKIGDPVPLRSSATTLICAKNKHADMARVEAGEDNDYKVLMMFRQSRGRFTKDQFLFPASPVHAVDRDLDGWAPYFKRRGLSLEDFPNDLEERLCAMRSLLVEMNLLMIPKEGGAIAEVQGPPGPKKWHMMVMETPKGMRDLCDVLSLPLTKCLENLVPFKRVQTPASETFRFDSHSYITTIDKCPEVKYTISTVGEQLIWVSPREALDRFNDGRMEMPTPNLILLSELADSAHTYDELKAKYNNPHSEFDVITPELVRNPVNQMATVLMPGDIHHTQTSPEERAEKFFHRFHYEKDWPHGVRAVYIHRPVEEEDDTAPLAQQPHALIEEINEYDKIYMNVPYPKREFNPADEGKTISPIPTHQLSDRPLNKEGYVNYEQKNSALSEEFNFNALMEARQKNKARQASMLNDNRSDNVPGYAPEPVNDQRVSSRNPDAKDDTRW